MKASEARGMADDELAGTLRDTEKHLFQLRFQAATDRLEASSEIAKARRDIARIRTEQRRRELDRLSAAGPDVLAKLAADLEPKTDGPGKRRAKRQLARVQRLHAAAAPAATKGK